MKWNIEKYKEKNNNTKKKKRIYICKRYYTCEERDVRQIVLFKFNALYLVMYRRIYVYIIIYTYL